MYSAIITTFHHGLNGARISVKCFDMPGRSFDYPHHVKAGEDAHAWAAQQWAASVKCPAAVALNGNKRSATRPRIMRGAVLSPGRFVWIIEPANGQEGEHTGTYPLADITSA
jgi:hypothetical protein